MVRRFSRYAKIVGLLAICSAQDFVAHAFAQSAPARTIIDDWGSVTPPPAPEVKPVRLDAAKTVLLVMDFNKTTCSEKNRPRCVMALAGIGRLLTEARAAGALIIHTGSLSSTTADIPDAVAARPGERFVAPRTDQLFGRMDKFFDSDLENTLRGKGIDTVLAVGTSANGAVLYTVSGAAARKFKVVVPVDAMPADTAYQEQFTAYQFMTAPVVRGNVVLTTTGQVTF